jgi:hypothetical protein
MTVRSHTIFAAAMLALSAAAFAPATASAQVGLNIVIGDAPPPPRFESVPVARRGYVWAPGYWNWDGHRHVWAAGRWEAERRGAQYRRAEWIRDDGGWRLDQGGWATVDSRPVEVDYITVAPPPPRYERVPPPRSGYVWAPGYWDWRGNRHIWIDGNWVGARPGYVYSQPRWIEHGGRWQRQESRWERGPNGDRDHDGIPNRYDRHDNGGYRDDHRNDYRHEGRRDQDHDGVPNKFDRDRDGDGVPNRYDHRPDNPRRD